MQLGPPNKALHRRLRETCAAAGERRAFAGRCSSPGGPGSAPVRGETARADPRPAILLPQVPPPDFFRKRGFLVKTAFLDRGTCADLCADARAARALPAEIISGPRGLVDPTIRHTWEVTLTTERAGDVASRIAELRAELADHFHVPLSGCEGASFLIYRPGGFYRPHRDRSFSDIEAAADARERRVTVVVFLNALSADPGPGEYAGGALTFYGLVADPAWREYGFVLDPTPGLLVAFRSDIFHEVSPVTAGERCTVVAWFHA